MKIGIFPGSFNPPTKAHCEIANLLYNSGLLDKIVFIPVKNNGKNLISIDHRINMLKCYTDNFNYLEVSSIMEDYNKFNYCVIDKLSQEYSNLYIIMGSDLLERFHTFDNYLMMLEKYHFIIIKREDIDVLSLIENNYYDYRDKFIVVDYCNHLSSSLVRANINNSLVINKMIDSGVLDYIRDNELYKDE